MDQAIVLGNKHSSLVIIKNIHSVFIAGDSRINTIPTLITMHVLFMREHNRLARKLKMINGHWDDERLYQEARRIVGAELQDIVYNEYVQHVMSAEGIDRWSLTDESKSYDPNIDPCVANHFATSTFRFAHGTIPTYYVSV